MYEDNNYDDFGADELNNVFGDSDKDMKNYFDHLLFWVQEIGKKKNVEGVEVFVKSQYWYESLKDLYKFL